MTARTWKTLLACGAIVALTPGSALAGKAELKAPEKSQSAIASAGKIPVESKGLKEKIEVVARSKTFDSGKAKKLTKPLELKPNDPDGKLKLTDKGQQRIESCEARKITIEATGSKDASSASFKLVRDTEACEPAPVDLSRSGECDPITLNEGDTPGDPLCMLPFPDDFLTIEDSSSATGRRVAFQNSAMAQNNQGKPIEAAPYNLNDGFSPGQAIVVKVPGLETPEALEATDPITLDNLSRNDEQLKNEPVVVIDTETGERWPIWVEIDSNASTPEETALLVHPARNFDSGHRYVVALRDLKDVYSEPLEAPDAFRYYRDDLPSDDPEIDAQRDRFETVFEDLRDAKVKRSNLYLAWDFTVSTDMNIAERMLFMRNDAFEQLGDTTMDDVQIQGDSPTFDIVSVEERTVAEDDEIARVVEGTFEVPCYLQPNCEPRGKFELGSDGLPSQNGTYESAFRCGIPRAAVDAPSATPARPAVYGHGLLGSRSQATSGDQRLLAQTHNFVFCSVDTIGFSQGDVGNIANRILKDFSNFPELTDRVQQGLLNTLYLGRLMWHPDGFVSNAAFHTDGATTTSPPVIDISRLYYHGNSQGGILGGAATAIAPDWTRASLGVPGMNYSVLLNRSVDFDVYSTILDPSYPSKLAQAQILSQIQMLWDRSEPNGYAHVMTDNPLPETPAHEVYLSPAFGDHQVTTWQADVQARTIDAQIHEPVVYDGRWPGVDVGWGIEPIDSYPHTDSSIVYWDSGPPRPNPEEPAEVTGTDPPPIENIPNRSGEDPHSDPRVDPEQMQMVSDWLRPDAQSQITDTCLGLPCFAGFFDGP